jgi:RNA polymerase sigma-70 factor (ECF subfamily)
MTVLWSEQSDQNFHFRVTLRPGWFHLPVTSSSTHREAYMERAHTESTATAIADRLRRSKDPRWMTTRWPLVQRAAQLDAAAVSALCEVYWYPVYEFIRGKGVGPEDARDITQGFFEGLVRRNDLARVDPARGSRFRSWLRRAAKSHLLNVWKARPRHQFSLDQLTGNERGSFEPKDTLTPARLFERHAALTILDRAWEKTRQHFVETGNEPLFEYLKQGLSGDGRALGDTEIAELLGKSQGDVRVQRHRLKSKHFPSCLRQTLREMGVPPDSIDDEIRGLRDALL